MLFPILHSHEPTEAKQFVALTNGTIFVNVHGCWPHHALPSTEQHRRRQGQPVEESTSLAIHIYETPKLKTVLTWKSRSKVNALPNNG